MAGPCGVEHHVTAGPALFPSLLYSTLEGDDADSTGAVQEAGTQQVWIRHAYHLHPQSQQGRGGRLCMPAASLMPETLVWSSPPPPRSVWTPPQTSRCVNQIEEVCRTIEKTINQTVQNTLNSLEKDCEAVSRAITATLVTDR